MQPFAEVNVKLAIMLFRHRTFVQSEGTQHVFNHRLSSIMVSGAKHAWKEIEEIVSAIAPASFYGGHKVEWANTTGVGVLTFMTSVRMVHSFHQDVVLCCTTTPVWCL